MSLAALGLYGVLSYRVSRRSSEIAIRIALGARSRRVIQMILGETVGVVILGLAAFSAAYLPARRASRVSPVRVLHQR